MRSPIRKVVTAGVIVTACLVMGGAARAVQPALDWAVTWSQTAGGEDLFIGSATDAAGNTYVLHYNPYGGGDGPNNTTGYTLLSYNSSGQLTSSVPLLGSNNGGGGEFYAMGMDPAGNLYVTGRQSNNGSNQLYLARYDPATGDLLWESGYAPGGSGYPQGNAITFDGAGNVWVAGEFRSYGGGMGSNNLGLLAGFSSAGTLVWATSMTGAENGEAVAVDGFNSAYVVGTASLGGMSGVQVVVVTKFDAAHALVFSRTVAASPSLDGVVAAFNASNDSLFVAAGGPAPLVLQRIDGATGDVIAEGVCTAPYTQVGVGGMALDAAGNVYVAYDYPAGPVGALGLMKFDSSLAEAPGWPVAYASGKDDGGSQSLLSNGRNWPSVNVSLDAAGRVFLAGGSVVGCGSMLPGTSDLVLRRYAADGTAAWTRVHDGAPAARVGGAVSDAAGNVYVSGQVGKAVTLRAYDPEGGVRWNKAFTTTSYCDLSPAGIASGGGVVVLMLEAREYSYSNSRGVSLILVYDEAGNQVALHDISDSSSDMSFGPVAVNAAGELYTAGRVNNSGMETTMAVKFGSSGPEWGTPVSVPGGQQADVSSLDIDAAGNVYLTLSGKTGGGGDEQGYLVKIDAAGNQLWTANPGAGVGFQALRVVGSNVYVSALQFNTSLGTLTALLFKYDLDGSLVWQQAYTSGSQPAQAFIGGIGADEHGNVAVSGLIGTFSGNSGNFDVLTASYSPAGALRWTKTWDSGSPNDFPRGLAMGSVYVAADNGVSGILLKYTEPYARLRGAIAATPAIVPIGSWVEIVLTVTNTGNLDAETVTPAIDLNAGASLVTVEVPVGAPVTIPAGGTRSFTWTYSVGGSGIVAGTATATGLELGTGIARSMYASGAFLTGVRLVSRLTGTPDPASCFPGQWFTLFLTVSNTGASPATGVAPVTQDNGGTAVLEAQSGPLPPGPVDLAPGSSTTFAWTFSVSGAGTVDLTVSATGLDPVLVPQTTAQYLGGAVGFGAALLSGALAASHVAQGMPITIWYTVTNSGNGDLAGAWAGLAVTQGAGSVVVPMSGPSGTVPIPQGGGSATFTWMLDTPGTGPVSFTASVTGTESASGMTRSVESSMAATVGAAELGSMLWADPPLATLVRGQTATVYLGVSSTTPNAVDGLTGFFQINSGAGNLSVLAGPIPASVATLSSMTATVFAWTVSVTGQGPVDLVVAASGVDASTGVGVATRQRWQAPIGYGAPSLQASLSIPQYIEQWHWCVVTLTVTNNGTGGAMGVQPVLTKERNQWMLNGPTPVVPGGPQAIPAGSSVTFEWTFTPSGWGDADISVTVTGQDAATGAPSGAYAAGTVVISQQSRLVGAASVSPNYVSVGTWVEVVMTVTNVGGVPQLNVSPMMSVPGGDGAIVYKAGPDPAFVPVLMPGAMTSFTWTYSVSGSGRVVFEPHTEGMDMVTGNTYWSDWPQPQAILDGELVSSLAFAPEPDATVPGDIYAAYLTVTNTGAGPLLGLVPSAGTGWPVDYMSGPAPSGVPSLASGDSVTFVWTLTVVGTGWLNQWFRVDATDGAGLPVATSRGFSNGVGSGASVLAAAASVNAPVSGQQIRFALTVTNTGNVALNNANPQLSTWTSPGNLNLQHVSGPVPACCSPIPNGGSVTYVWTYSTSGWGTLAFAITVTGQDSGSGNNRMVGATMPATVTPPPPSVLSVQVGMSSTSPSLGEVVTVRLTVSNTGVGASMGNANASVDFNNGGSLLAYVSGPVPNTGGMINGPGGITYVWTYTATGAGSVGMGLHADAQDNGPGGHMNFYQGLDFEVMPPSAVLESSLDADVDPAKVLPGGVFTIRLSVQNTGAAAANNVTPSLQINAGDGPVAALLYGSAASLPLPPGTSTVFQWTLSVTGAGFFSMTLTATGTEAGTGRTVSTVQSGEGMIGYGVADLKVGQHSDAVFTGQVLTITLTVTNAGNNALTSVVPALTLTGGSAVLQALTGPVPAGLAALPPGSTTSFVWTFLATGWGSATFDGRVSGVDAGSLNPNSESVAGTANVTPIAQLAAALSVSPNPTQPGDWTTLTLTVTNVGGVAALSVSAFIGADSGAGLVDLRSGPTPPGPVDLGPGISQSFAWTFTVTGYGLISFTATGLGTEQVSGIPRDAAASAALSSGAHLVVSLNDDMAPIPEPGQEFTISLTVTNDGANTADGVTPWTQLNAGGAGLQQLTGPLPPGPVTVAAGSSTTFAWTYRILSGVMVDWTFTATGSDAVSAAPLVSALTVGGPLGYGAGALDASLAAAGAYAGQLLRVVLTVTNTGTDAVSGVIPVLSPASGGSLLSLPAGPAPAGPVTIAAGATVAFTWTFTPTGAGPVVFSVTVSGQDVGTLQPRSDSAALPVTIVVPPPASLATSLTIAPASPVVGQSVTVSLTVTNTGIVRVNGVSPALLVNVGGSLLNGTGGPLPAGPVHLAPGTSTTFTWTADAIAAGQVSLSATATGVDGYTSATIRSVSSAAGIIRLPGGQLYSGVVLPIDPAGLVKGETFKVVNWVINLGVDDVTGVAPVRQMNVNGAGLSLVSGPAPASMALMVPLAVTVFEWTFSVTGQGAFDVSLTTTGTDAVTLLPVVSATLFRGVTGWGAGLLVATMTTTGAAVGLPFTITMTVSNTGNDAVGSVAPSLSVISGASLVSYVSGPAPAGPAGIGIGAGTTFSWVYTANGVGAPVFQGTAAGLDAGSNAPRSVSATVTPSIRPAARLVATLTLTPSSAQVGWWTNAVLQVSNVGALGATGVAPFLDINTGASLPLELITPAGGAQDIPAGGSKSFTWTYSVSGSGIATFTATGVGAEAGTGAVRLASAQATLYPQLLSALVVDAPISTVRIGDNFVVYLTVTNAGASTVTNVMPHAQVNIGGAGTVSQPVGVDPAGPVTLVSGASRTFTWNWKADAAGPVDISFTVTGTDSVSSLDVLTRRIATGTIGYGAAALTAWMTATPARVGQMLTVTLSVSNSGNDQAISEAPWISVTQGSSRVALAGGQAPPGSFSIDPDETKSVSWTYSAVGTGAVTFSGGMDGVDFGTSVPRSAAADVFLTVTPPPASLVAGVLTAPPLVYPGTVVSVYLTATNTGGVNATGVTPALQVNAGGGLVAPVGGPMPTGPLVVGPNSMGYFLWTFTATGPGQVAWTGTVTGFDPATSSTVMASATAGITILSPAALAAEMHVDLGPASTGMWTRVYITVTNTGSAPANAVTPALQFNSGGSLVTVVAVPGSAAITAGASHTFAWTLSVNGGGPVAMTATAAGTDAASGAIVLASASHSLFTANGATLAASMTVSPPAAAPGQWVEVRLTVTNTGTPAANAVAPAISVVSGGSLVAAQGGVSPAGPQAIPAFGNVTFVWTYSVSGNGVVRFSATASGTDAATGMPVSGSGAATLTASVGAVLVATVALNPPSPSVGQLAVISLVVTNPGAVSATAVSPSLSYNAGGALVVPQGGVAPAGEQTILAGSSTTFTWTVSISGAGTLALTATAVGTDTFGWTPVLGAGTTSATLRAASSIVAALSAGPPLASVGTWVRVALTVTNTGGVNVTGLTPVAAPQLNAGAASVALISGPAPAGPVVLAPGAAQTFVWTFSASGAGAVSWTATAFGADGGTGWSRSAAGTAGLTTLAASSLAAAVSLSPPGASVGQWVRIALTVTNTGGVNVNSVTPAALPQFNVGAGLVTYKSGPLPTGPVVLGPGAFTTFVWTYSVAGAGTVDLTGTATGVDSGTGLPMAAGASRGLPVVAGASLAAGLTVVPASPSVGQPVEIRLTVTNTGGVAANAVAPLPGPQVNAGAGLVTFQSGPLPAGPVTLAPGSSTTFVWTYQVTGVGALSWTATAGGFDSGSGADVYGAGTRTATSVSGAALAAYAAAFPGTRNTGQGFLVTLTVTNTGSVAANSLAVVPFLSIGAAATPSAGPTPAVPASLAAGASATFTWTFSGAVSGTVVLCTTVTGVDAGSAAALSTGPVATGSVLLQKPAAFDAAVVALTSPVSVGQGFLVTLTVTNMGEATANGVNASAFLKSGAGNATVAAGPNPALPVTLAGGASRTFTWTFTGAAAGGVSLTTTVTGTDANTSAAVPLACRGSNAVTVQAAAVLAASVRAFPAQVSVGQSFLLTVTVTNSGQAAATGFGLAALTMTGTGTAAVVAGPTPALPATLNGGQALTFTWTCSGATAGGVGFSTSASGADTNSGLPVASILRVSNSVLVQTAASLSATMIVTPGPRNTGQPFMAVLSLLNSGQAAVTGLSAPSILKNGTGTVTGPVGPTPGWAGTLAGGASAVFTWTFTGTVAGTPWFSTTVAGTEANTGAALSAQPVSGIETILTPGALDVSVVALESQVSVGQVYMVTVTVTNTGGSAVNGVNASAFVKSGTGNATYAAGPNPALPVVLAGGAAQTFTWTYTGATAGGVVLSTNVTGTDANSGAAVASGAKSSNSVTVQSAAVLTGTLSVPATWNTGQAYLVSLTLVNAGGAAASGVVALPPFNVVAGPNTGLAMYTDGPNPAMPFSIAGGASKLFTWTYTGASTGSVLFSTTVTATDANSGAAVATLSLGSNALTIQTGAMVSAAIAVPATAVVGDIFALSVTVTNTGNLSGTSFVPSVQFSGAGAAVIVSGPALSSSVVLAPAGSCTYIWQVRASSAGAVTVTAGVAVRDSGSGTLLQQVLAATVTVSAPAGPALAVTVAQGRMLVAPNLLDLALPGASLTFHGRGTPNGAVEVRVYDAAGGYMGALSMRLDAQGTGSVTLTGNRLEGKELGTGVYWALPSGGGVSGRKPFMVQGRKH